MDGKLQSLEDLGRTVEPALDVREMPPVLTKPTPKERAARETRVKESLVGRELCLWWGGDWSKPYQAKVVAEDAQQIVVQSEDNGFEILHRTHRDRIFFDSREDGQKERDERKAEWDRKQKAWEKKIAAKNGR